MLYNNCQKNIGRKERIGELQIKLEGVKTEIHLLKKEFYKDECYYIDLKQKQYFLEMELQMLMGDNIKPK